MSSALCERESAHRGHDKGHSVWLFVAVVLHFILLLLLVVLFFFFLQNKKRMQLEFLKAYVAYLQPLRKILNKL